RETFGREPRGDWLDPYRSLAAAEDRRARRRGIEALALAGVRALLVPPAQLERAVFDAYADLRRRRLV
ncbi:MAG: hypothetical protein JSR54_11100, partial [Proteobacteria bacterium]|nr:hypothetical protein [Pseudomonadota bacterium]